jgi:CheY-like chemotaxis protein
MCAGPKEPGALFVNTQPKVILLAEDNSDDAYIFQRMFRRAKLPHLLHTVEDGQGVIDWLSGAGEYADRTRFPLPDILLLDLKMPIRTGFEVLEWLQRQKGLQELPVIILSSSDEKRDMERADKLGAKNYFVKSPDLADVLQYLHAL